MYINPNVAEPKTVRVLSGCRETSLRIPVRLFAGEDEVTPTCPALIDTGAEICVLKRGLIPDKYLRPATKPLRLVGANERRLEGGDKEVTLNLCVGSPDIKVGIEIGIEIDVQIDVEIDVEITQT